MWKRWGVRTPCVPLLCVVLREGGGRGWGVGLGVVGVETLGGHLVYPHSVWSQIRTAPKISLDRDTFYIAT